MSGIGNAVRVEMLGEGSGPALGEEPAQPVNISDADTTTTRLRTRRTPLRMNTR
jgi:hypothetical protein